VDAPVFNLPRLARPPVPLLHRTGDDGHRTTQPAATNNSGLFADVSMFSKK
jgi:hypothetical protein